MAVQKVLIDTDGITQLYPITRDVCVFDENDSLMPNVYLKMSKLKTINNISLIGEPGDNIQISDSGDSYEILSASNTSTSTGYLVSGAGTHTDYFLRGDGSWQSVSGGGGTTYEALSSSSTTNNNYVVTGAGSANTGKFLKGNGTWDVPTNTTYAKLTASTTSTSTSYVVPGNGGNTGYFLRGDGTWQEISGGGGTTYEALSASSTTDNNYVVTGAGSTNTGKFLRGDGTWQSVSVGGPDNTTEEGTSLTISTLDGNNIYNCTNTSGLTAINIGNYGSNTHLETVIFFKANSSTFTLTVPVGTKYVIEKPIFTLGNNYMLSFQFGTLAVAEYEIETAS